MMKTRLSGAAALLIAALVTSCIGGDSSGAGGMGSQSLTATALPPLGAAFDSAYGDLLVQTPGCFAVAHANGLPQPSVETYSPSGDLLGSWDRGGSGPGELRSIDGMATFGDSIVVWDRANSRLTVLDCDSKPQRAIQTEFVGLDLGVASGDVMFLSIDPVAPGYGIWFINGIRGDSASPRIGKRLRAAKDLIVTGLGNEVAFLDVSVGALLRYRPGEALPYRVDTLPAALQQPLRRAFRSLYASTPTLAEAELAPMYALWAQLLPGDTLAVGLPEDPVVNGIAIALWPIGSDSTISVLPPPDPLERQGIYTVGGARFKGDTLYTLTRDSLHRFLVHRGP